MLLNRLKVWQKLLLLAVLGAVLVAVPLGLLVRDELAARTLNRHQADGIEPLRQTLQAVQLVQQHRGLSAQTLSGRTDAGATRNGKAQAITAALAALDAIVRARSDDVVLTSFWQQIPGTWQALATSVGNAQIEPAAAFAAHTALIQRLLDLLGLIANHHDLALTPDKADYFLQRAIIDQLPPLAELMGQTRARGVAVLTVRNDGTVTADSLTSARATGGTTRSSISEADQLEMQRLHDAIQHQARSVSGTLTAITELDPALGERLRTPVTAANAQVEELAQLVLWEFIEADTIRFDAGEFFRISTAAIDVQFALIDSLLDALETRIEVQAGALQRQQQLLAAAMVGIALLTGGLTLAIVRTITAPLSQTARVLQTAAGGDLTRRLRPRSRDELGHMGRDLDVFLDALSRSIGEIADTAQQLGQSSQALTEVSRRVNDGAARTTTDAEKLSIAAADMNERVASVATATSQMNTAVHEIARSTAEGARVTGEAVSLASAATTAMQRLDESSARIGEVVALISHITRQTRLLALNATIEAARAGEAGRGFGVVAHEVKELADGTARATQDIADKIGTIQSDTAGAVEAIRGIGDSVGRVNTLQTTIAAAIEEQSVVTDDISRNIAQAATRTGEIGSGLIEVTQIAAGAAASGRELESAAHALAQMGAQLRDLVQLFRYAT